jgi:glycosyltransferase involved in cell wall biosynthesis
VNILLVACWDLSRDDAPTIHVDAVARGLARRGHAVVVVAPEGRAPPRPRDVPYTRSLLPVGTSRFAPHLFALEAARAVAWASPRPDVVYVRDFEASALPLLAARAAGLPTVLEANGILEQEAQALGFDGALHGTLVRGFARTSLRLAGRVLAVSPEVVRHAIEAVGRSSTTVVLVENGIDPEQVPLVDRATARARTGLPASAPLLGFLGGFQAWQGVERLIEAVPPLLARVPEARVVVAGFGPSEGLYRATAKRMGVEERVLFPGRIPIDEAHVWNAAFDVGVHLARPPRACSSVKLVNYAAAGTPVLASRVADFRFVEEKGIGVLVDFDDVHAIARAAADLLLAPERRAELGARARSWALAERTWDQVAAITERALEDVTAGA